MPETNEWTFASDVCKTIQAILTENPGLPFSEAKVEVGAKGTRKRRDLTLYGMIGEAALTGEIKLPDRPDGQSPYSSALLQDAFEKANAKGVEYFFTWNVNRFVLWKTFEAKKPVAERDLEHFNVTSIRSNEELSNPGVQAEIKGVLTQILGRFARILEGTEPIRSRPLDEKFIRVLESALEIPILQTWAAVSRLYSSDHKFARQLDVWMRDSQGWLISTDPRIVRDNLERTAKFTCYVLVNKIVFQQALRRRFSTLRRIRVSESVKTSSKLRDVFQAAFEEAKRVSHDYETVFDGDFGDTVPFLEDATVENWRELMREIEGFDFSKIDYDIIGHIFERLISPEERHRYGQHYTRSEIVDLINSFSIRKPGATVLDPACGGGTFLVRAYVLKRELSGSTLPHVDLLQQIKGVDISAYAAHLATINLATRDLIDERNYPLVARSNFFHVKKGEAVFHIPLSVHGKGKQMVPLEIGEVDAVVGNPPYVRQEELPKDYKKLLTDLIESEFPDAGLSGRSDLHCYFWPHATSFLKEDGYYGFLTSSGWLDTEYGFHLQEWLLRHFAILALFESNCEPWFTGARVTTVATLLRRESDPAKRASNTIRFVSLRKPLKEVLESFNPAPLKAARMLRDFVESQNENLVDEHWRIRVVNQHELWKVGCIGGVAGVASVASDPIPVQAKNATIKGGFSFLKGEYLGGKWGIYLRAPDIFFKLLDRCGSRLVPLGQLAEIRFGVKSGADDFFYVRDVTEDEITKCSAGLPLGSPQIARRFKEVWSIPLEDTNRVRIVEAGDRSRHMIEAEYLEPEVHSLMEIDSVEIDPAKLSRKILLVSDPLEQLKGTHVQKYIKWGEREGFDQGATCAARGRTRSWYDLAVVRRSPILWPKAHQYRHIVPINEKRFIPNCRMYDLFLANGVDSDLLAGALNSTIVALFKFLYGRPVGREGSLDTEVVDVNMMLVPDVRAIHPQASEKTKHAIGKMRERSALPLIEEFELADRQSLDDATLELLGIADAEERESLRILLYSQVQTLYKEIRDVELKKQVERRITSRRDRASPRTIAGEIWEELDKTQLRIFPEEFIPKGEATESVTLPAGTPKVLDDLFERGALQINENVVRLGSKGRAEFAAKIVELGHYGKTQVPQTDRVCERALETYHGYEAQMEAQFRALAEERSADSEIQARIVRELCKLLRTFNRSH
ncbi:MAG: N-6 DNA methylase [Acidobacteriia bacterium]|nr:N-6 DNA methylase [Terriglobia bacterium]